MATLSDFSLRRRIDRGELISNWRKPLSIQPASVEVRLDENIIAYRRGDENITLDENGYELLPGEFILASTQERIHVPADLVARVEGKSSWARRGILVHVSAGYIDPGFQGNVTLEIANLHSAKSAHLYPGDRIAQIAFEDLDRPASMPYGTDGLGSHYQGQAGVTPSSMGVK
jgi:dCTP deaminase